MTALLSPPLSFLCSMLYALTTFDIPSAIDNAMARGRERPGDVAWCWSATLAEQPS